MQVESACNCHKTSASPKRKMLMHGLGWVEFIAPVANALLAPNGGSSVPGAASAPGTAINVNPNINVSPQISPIFQQQFQPSNSPISAGTSQVAPFSVQHPDPNYAGGNGTGSPVLPNASIPGAPDYSSIIPQVGNAPIDWSKYALYGGIGLAALLVIKMVMQKKAPTTRYRNVVARKRRSAVRRIRR